VRAQQGERGSLRRDINMALDVVRSRNSGRALSSVAQG
jgi:hypothetical protein